MYLWLLTLFQTNQLNPNYETFNCSNHGYFSCNSSVMQVFKE